MKTYKVSVLGDLMCEPPLFESSKKKNGKFDFWPSFKPLKGILDEADYVIGNLETPIAGEDLGYTASMVSFNAPFEYLEALKKLGVDMVSTANNHSLDRGVKGLQNTIDALDKIGIAHTGTYKSADEKNHNGYFTLGDGTKIAVIASTYGTNPDINRVNLEGKDRLVVNYHRATYKKKAGSNVPMSPELKATRELISNLLGREMTWDEGVQLKQAMHHQIAYANDNFRAEAIDEGVKIVYDRDVKEARREKADLIFAIPHSGGQFAINVGRESSYTMRKVLNSGVDAVFMNHSHTTQKAAIYKGSPCFYALGNVTMDPESFYQVPENLPNFGIIPHLYIANGKIVKTTFSVFKIMMNEKRKMIVVPADELYASLTSTAEKKDLADKVAEVVARVTETNKEVRKPKREYDLKA